MTERTNLILKAIIQTFINTAKPVGSKLLQEKLDIDISSATIRNDMSKLEELGLIQQPHTSAGRIPTELGFRKFVDEMLDQVVFEVPQELLNSLVEINQAKELLTRQKFERRVNEAVMFLSKMSKNVSFATLPWMGKTFYLGIANVLKEPEFQDPMRVSSVVEVLEDSSNFTNILNKLEITDQIRVYIGQENLVKEIQSCTMLATNYSINQEVSGVIGILGPTRMMYARNIAALNSIKNDLLN